MPEKILLHSAPLVKISSKACRACSKVLAALLCPWCYAIGTEVSSLRATYKGWKILDLLVEKGGEMV